MQLNTELIPDHCPSNVRNIYPKLWPQIRSTIIQKAYCEICNTKTLKSGKPKKFEAHEVWEFKDGIQSLVSIRCTCKLCHLVHHLCHTQQMGSKWFNLAIIHFCKVNNCNIEVFNNYFQNKLSEWNDRNKIQWQLDTESIKNVLQNLNIDIH